MLGSNLELTADIVPDKMVHESLPCLLVTDFQEIVIADAAPDENLLYPRK